MNRHVLWSVGRMWKIVINFSIGRWAPYNILMSRSWTYSMAMRSRDALAPLDFHSLHVRFVRRHTSKCHHRIEAARNSRLANNAMCNRCDLQIRQLLCVDCTLMAYRKFTINLMEFKCKMFAHRMSFDCPHHSNANPNQRFVCRFRCSKNIWK